MKKLMIALVFAFTAQLASAQFSFYSTSTDLLNKSSQEVSGHEEKKQLYHISFKDMILVHTIFDEETGEVSDSQIYQIVETKEEDKIIFQCLVYQVRPTSTACIPEKNPTLCWFW
jgi:hypothetical protein